MEEIISLSYGSGGKKTDSLIKKYILPSFDNEFLTSLGDGASLDVKRQIAFSTDSFVIDPIFFPGGDIGKLSVCGTVNDLLMCGSIPKYLSLSLIIEEGLLIKDFEKIVESIGVTAKKAGACIVTGDTKVVEKGHGHGIFINTAGIGERISAFNLGKDRICAGDKVILTGSCGNHGVSVMCARQNFFEGNIVSDCTPLNEAVEVISRYGEDIRIMRDPTRGGVATTLNEFVENNNFSIEIEESQVPIDEDVKTACNLLGIDPLYSANEGKILIVCNEKSADSLVEALKKIDYCKQAAVIGEVVDYMNSKVILKSEYGGKRILSKLSHDMLPRIC